MGKIKKKTQTNLDEIGNLIQRINERLGKPVLSLEKKGLMWYVQIKDTDLCLNGFWGEDTLDYMISHLNGTWEAFTLNNLINK